MSRQISKLSPYMQAKAVDFLNRCREEKLNVVIICTDRSNAEQAECFARGASRARPGESAHNVCDDLGRPAAEAFDIGVIRDGKYIGDGNDHAYKRAGEIGEELGLIWAGRWIKMKEVAHFQSPMFGKEPPRK